MLQTKITEGFEQSDQSTPNLPRMTVKATVDTATFTPLVKAVSNISESARLRFTPDGIKIAAISDDNTTIGEIEYRDAEYNSAIDTEVSVGVNLTKLVSEFTSFEFEERSTLILRQDQDEMRVTKGNLMGEIPIYSPESVPMTPPFPMDRNDYSGRATVSIQDLKGAFGRVSGTPTGTVVFEILRDSLRVGTVFRRDDEDPEEIIDADMKGIGSEEVLVEMDNVWAVLGALAPSGEIELSVSHERPLELKTENARFQIAPKLDK